MGGDEFEEGDLALTVPIEFSEIVVVAEGEEECVLPSCVSFEGVKVASSDEVSESFVFSFDSS